MYRVQGSQGREADHLSPSSVETENGGAIFPTSLASSFHGAQLLEHSGNIADKPRGPTSLIEFETAVGQAVQDPTRYSEKKTL